MTTVSAGSARNLITMLRESGKLVAAGRALLLKNGSMGINVCLTWDKRALVQDVTTLSQSANSEFTQMIMNVQTILVYGSEDKEKVA